MMSIILSSIAIVLSIASLLIMFSIDRDNKNKLFFKKPLTSGAFCGIIAIEGKEEEPWQQIELSSKDL